MRMDKYFADDRAVKEHNGDDVFTNATCVDREFAALVAVALNSYEPLLDVLYQALEITDTLLAAATTRLSPDYEYNARRLLALSWRVLSEVKDAEDPYAIDDWNNFEYEAPPAGWQPPAPVVVREEPQS